MKHYVVILNWATEDESGIEIIGVRHNLEDAQTLFEQKKITEKAIAKENGWQTIIDDADCFEAYVEGYYDNGHSSLYIQEVDDLLEDLRMEQQEQM
jgi:hypothetical protein